MKNFSFYRFGRWLIVNGLFAACLVAGYYYDMVGWRDVFVFFTATMACVVTVLGILTSIPVFATTYKGEAVKAAIPTGVDVLYDVATIVALVYAGAWFVALLYVWNMLWQALTINNINQAVKARDELAAQGA
jgi:hypothetical protein